MLIFLLIIAQSIYPVNERICADIGKFLPPAALIPATYQTVFQNVQKTAADSAPLQNCCRFSFYPALT